MLSFLKKDLLVFWRDRKEVLLSLLLPIGIILLLNFAFTGLFDEGADAVNIDVAIVQEDNEAIGLEQFAEKVDEMDRSASEKEALLMQAAEISPNQLMNDFLHDEEMKAWIDAIEMNKTEAVELVDEGELDAIITIPEGFTASVLGSIFFEENVENPLTINVAEESNEVGVLQNIVSNYMDTVNLRFGLGSLGATLETEPVLPEGGREVVEGMESFTMAQYFTIAMASLFSLFTAQTVAMKTVTEKRERVFNRITLTNSKPANYLMGKIISTFMLSWLQLMFIFIITQLLLDVFPAISYHFWIGAIIIITALAIAVSGLSALFTTITLRLENPNGANGICTMIVLGLGMLGGSFFPIEAFPEWMQKFGLWTPNGLAQSSFLNWIQYGKLEELISPMSMLFGFFVLCFLIGMLLFPRRERI